MQSFVAVLCLLSLFASPFSARAYESESNETVVTDQALNYEELDAIAKSAINDEVTELNDAVEHIGMRKLHHFQHPVLKGYKNSDLKIFQEFGKTEGIDPSVLYDLCALTTTTITAVTAKKFTKQNLQVTASLTAINTTRTQVNGKFFGVVESACLNAKARFMTRLQTLTSNGKPLDLSATAIKNVSDVVFFPTNYAKQNLGKKLLKALPYIINGALIIGAASSLAGVADVGIWMSIVSISGASFAIKNLLPQPDEILQQRKLSTIEIKNGVQLDLTPAEKSQLGS